MHIFSQSKIVRGCVWFCKMLYVQNEYVRLQSQPVYIMEINTKLSCAILKNDVKLVRNMLSRFPPINRNASIHVNCEFDTYYPYSIVSTLLHLTMEVKSTEKDKLHMITCLIENGENPNSIDEDGISVVWKCLSRGYLDICLLLLNSGADPYIGEGPRSFKKVLDRMFLETKFMKSIQRKEKCYQIIDFLSVYDLKYAFCFE